MTELESLKKEHSSVQQENENLKKRLEQFEQACSLLTHQLQMLRRNQFGSKSERIVDADNPQLALFEKQVQQAPAPSGDTEIEVPAHKRRKKAKKNTDNLPREICIIPVNPEDMICPCGCKKKVIRYEIKELFHYKPAEFLIIEQRREVVACTKGCEQSIKIAPAPKHVLPKVKATEELLAATVINKLHHRQPLYHLEKYAGFADISRETMARWHIQLINPLQPLFNLLKDEVIDYDIASIDATGLQVLKEPGRSAKTKSYMYCIRGGPPDKPVVLYAYNAKKHKRFVDEWFEGFRGSVHMDADPFFDLLLKDDNVNPSNCNAHARRYFENIVKQTQGKKGLAHAAVEFYRKLYIIERHTKDQKLSSEERCHYRLENSKPILIQLKAWLDENYQYVLPKSPLGKAFEYAINHWEGLTHFLTDGRLEIDNNLTEEEIKPIALGRKNFMFANSVYGAHALAMHFSFIRTALANHLDPYKYYIAVLKRLPLCCSVEEYAELLPWNINLDPSLN